jgi:hypothetical protein
MSSAAASQRRKAAFALSDSSDARASASATVGAGPSAGAAGASAWGKVAAAGEVGLEGFHTQANTAAATITTAATMAAHSPRPRGRRFPVGSDMPSPMVTAGRDGDSPRKRAGAPPLGVS